MGNAALLRASASPREAKILSCKGRWQSAGLTEGCPATGRASPLHHSFAAVPLPLQGRNYT